MLIASVSAWDTEILSYYGSMVSNTTNPDTINHIDILNTSLTELYNFYDFINLISVLIFEITKYLIVEIFYQ